MIKSLDTPYMPGAMELVQFFHKHHIHQAVATSSIRPLLEGKRDHHQVFFYLSLLFIPTGVIPVLWCVGLHFGWHWTWYILIIFPIHANRKALPGYLLEGCRAASCRSISMHCLWRQCEWNESRTSCWYLWWRTVNSIIGMHVVGVPPANVDTSFLTGMSQVWFHIWIENEIDSTLIVRFWFYSIWTSSISTIICLSFEQSNCFL